MDHIGAAESRPGSDQNGEGRPSGTVATGASGRIPRAVLQGFFDSKARPGARRRMSLKTLGPYPLLPDIMKSPSTDITQDPRWASIVTRDRTADGTFWYSVATTGVFCRPSCPSRLANPKNVRLHESIVAAEAAGFRACRRCNPDGISIEAANNAIVAKACKLIDEAGETLSLAQVAESVEFSPHYFHRLFKKATGLTPKAYAVAGRSARLRDGLTKAATVTEAISRGRLRIERALLRGLHRRARHEPDALSIGRRPGGADLCRRPMLARRHPRRLERQGCRGDPAR